MTSSPSNTAWAREEIVRILRSHGFDSQAGCADVKGTIGADLISALLTADRRAKEECSRIAEQFGDGILVIYERPGWPPGNCYRGLTGADVANAIRSLPPTSKTE